MASKEVLALPVPVVLAKLVKFWNVTNARDKTARIIQYFTKFLAFYMAQNGHDKKVIAKLNALSAQMSLSRKAFRLAKSVNFYSALATHLKKPMSDHKDFISFLLPALHSIGYGVYMACDAYNYAAKVKLIDNPNDKIIRLGNWSWFMGLSASVLKLGVDCYDSRTKLKDVKAAVKRTEDPKEKEKLEVELVKAKAKVKSTYISFVRDAADLTVPLSFLESGPWYPNSGQAGFLGTVAAVIGAYELWPEN